MNTRGLTLIPAAVRTAFLDLISPVADRLVRWGVHPNTLTVAGAVVVCGAGAAFGAGFPRVGAGWLLISGLLDIFDGNVARRGGTASTFGAFFDSTLDRVGDAALFSGIAVYFVTAAGQRWPMLGLAVTLLTLSGSFIVSYARARAEGLGLDCKVGLVQRAERIVGLGVPTLVFGAGPHGWLLLGLMAVLAFANSITVVQRVAHVYRLTVPQVPGRGPKGGVPAALVDAAPMGG
jgi:CDP-diacylglycerol--glycerol-3-phosphate 3-phosphatidyltransferase